MQVITDKYRYHSHFELTITLRPLLDYKHVKSNQPNLTHWIHYFITCRVNCVLDVLVSGHLRKFNG